MSQAEKESISPVERFGIAELDLDRKDAANLNPLIGSCARDTMSRCARFIRLACAEVTSEDHAPAAVDALKAAALALEYEDFAEGREVTQ